MEEPRDLGIHKDLVFSLTVSLKGGDSERKDNSRDECHDREKQYIDPFPP